MSQGYLGEIRIFAGADLPQGWVPCDGQGLGFRDDYALRDLLGEAYDLSRSFDVVVPDLRARFASGAWAESPRGTRAPNYTSTVGAGVSADNTQPFLGMTFGFCVAGEYPTPFQPPSPYEV